MSRKVTLAGRFRKRLSPLFLSVIFTVTYYGRLFNGYFLPTCVPKRHRESRKARITKKPAFIKASFLILQNEVRGISPDEPSCAGSFC